MRRQPGRPQPVRENPANGTDNPPLKAGESTLAHPCHHLRETKIRKSCRTPRMAEVSPSRVIRPLNPKDSRLEARRQAHHPQFRLHQPSLPLRPRSQRGAGHPLLLPQIPRARPSPPPPVAVRHPQPRHHQDQRLLRPLRHHRLHRHHLQERHHLLHHPPHQLQPPQLPHPAPPLREAHHRLRPQPPPRPPADRLLQEGDHREQRRPKAVRSGAAPTVWPSRRSPACRLPCATV